ncbi:hypothetical protein LCGC14_1636460 [marine sediment metagenome]|uniref:Uncharacterized protein n=1 Tax=marine sediment metagenome TaxID=412755 RepID=A0A0F9KGP8_9ZZZZ
MTKITHMAGITCSYCDKWKYLNKRKEDKLSVRLCSFNPDKIGKEYLITSDSSICKRFILSDYFFCEKNNHQTSIDMCRNRVRNEKGFKGWEYCEKCLQYRKSVCLLVRMMKSEAVEETEKPKLKLKRRKL